MFAGENPSHGVGTSDGAVLPALIHRAAVVFDTPHASAAARADLPGTTIATGTLPWSPEPLAPRPGPLQTGLDALGDANALEFRDGAEDVHLQLASRRGGVDAFGQAHERDPERLEFVEQGDRSTSKRRRRVAQQLVTRARPAIDVLG